MSESQSVSRLKTYEIKGNQANNIDKKDRCKIELKTSREVRSLSSAKSTIQSTYKQS